MEEIHDPIVDDPNVGNIPAPAVPVQPVARSVREISVPKYAKYLKDIVANKNRLTEYATVALNQECTSKIQNKLPTKLKDPGSFTLHITLSQIICARGLCDLGASINLMPTSWYRKMGLGSPKPIDIVLQLVDMSLARPDGIIEDVLVQVGSLIFPMDFVILDFKADLVVLFILGQPFLATGQSLIDVAAGKMTMQEHDKVEVFDVYRALKLPSIYEEFSSILIIDLTLDWKLVLSDDPLKRVLMDYDFHGDSKALELV
ncbi:uncharacterized protein LOC124887789 [Capsicum annuum]|uniref:uncharacterized protein LOC124887789 n=1 Tax=Capsicum annuum TaxID=4072 RepID=UPI001FB04FB9|nr:uncharacterized protein LOC124887789 [Capsicum annuum]